MVVYDRAPESAITGIFDALNELTDYRIIYSFKSENPPPFTKKHIKIISWAPQFDILSHPKTKLFLSHGGLKRF